MGVAGVAERGRDVRGWPNDQATEAAARATAVAAHPGSLPNDLAMVFEARNQR